MNIESELLDLGSHLISNPVNYKYYSAKVGLMALEKRTLQFSHSSAFNDPFDNNVNLFKFTKEEVHKYHNRIIKKHKGNNYLEIFRLNRNLQNKVLPNHDIWMKQLFDGENANRGITCFSKKFNQMQMWAHYADKHQGICIGYDLLKIRSAIVNFNKESTFISVNYVDEIKPSSPFINDNVIFHWFGTKHNSWSYEEEIRLISRPLSFDNKRYLFQIPVTSIAEIYCGYEIDSEDLYAVKAALRKDYSHVKLFQITPDYESFTLNRKEISF